MTAHELAEEGDIGEIEVVGDLLDAFLRVFQLIAHIGQHRLAVGATLHAQAIVDQLAVATEELDLLLREVQDGILIQDLTQPLFAKGQLTGQLKIAKAKQEEASLQFQQTLLQAGAEVNEALVQYQTAQEKRELYAQQVNALQTAYRSTSLLMEHGTTTYLEVLTAQQSLLSAQLTQVANEVTEIQSLIQLYQALGGGAE